MSGDGLSLNIPGAAADVASVNTQHGILKQAAGSLLGESNKLFNGALLGSGADAGTEFSQKLNSALAGSREVIQAVNGHVGNTSEETIGFDRGGFASNYSG
jgi:hypothetical protein